MLNLIDIIKDKHEIKKYFQGSLPRNGNMSCQGNFGYEKYGCNYISTSTVAVILDDTENVLHLFMGERFLTSSNTKENIIRKTRIRKKLLSIDNRLIYQNLMAMITSSYLEVVHLA